MQPIVVVAMRMTRSCESGLNVFTRTFQVTVIVGLPGSWCAVARKLMRSGFDA